MLLTRSLKKLCKLIVAEERTVHSGEWTARSHGRLERNPISAQELNCSTNRGLQKIIGLDPLILRCKKPLSRHNSRREFVGMPMTELRQIRQHRKSGSG